jgi:hypothetical protein
MKLSTTLHFESSRLVLHVSDDVIAAAISDDIDGKFCPYTTAEVAVVIRHGLGKWVFQIVERGNAREGVVLSEGEGAEIERRDRLIKLALLVLNAHHPHGVLSDRVIALL